MCCLKRIATVIAFLSASLSVPAFAEIIPPDQVKLDANGVNLLNLDYQFSRIDVTVGPTDDPLQYIRYYSGLTGYGYDNTIYYISGDPQAVGTVYVVGTALSESFTCGSTGCISNEKNGSQLIADLPDGDGNYKTKYIMRDGTTILFSNFPHNFFMGNLRNASSLAQRITYPNGRYTSIAYGHAGYLVGSTTVTTWRVASLTDTRGYKIAFTYLRDTGVNSSNIQEYVTMTAAKASNDNSCRTNSTGCAGSAGMPSMSYATTGSPATQIVTTDAVGKVTTFNYGGSSELLSMVRPDHTSPDITISYVANTTGLAFTPFKFVSSVTVGGQTWNYGLVKNGTTNTTTTVTDPLSHQNVITSSAQPPTRIASFKDALNRTTSYSYDSNNRLQKETAPEGNYIQFTYDARGNVTQTTLVPKTGSGLSNIVTTANFDASCGNVVKCNQPNWTKDARLNQTDYGYDPTTGLLTSVTLPAPTASAPRPQIRYGYTALQAFYTASSPFLLTPIQMLTSISQCQTMAATSCPGTVDEQKTTNVYNTSGSYSNLSLSTRATGAGDNSLVATTAFAFDLTGNVYTVTGPLGAADITRYRYDAARQLVGVVGPDPDGAGPLKYRAIRTTYNGDGNVTLAEQGTVNSQSDADWPGFVSLQQVATGYDNAARKVQDSLTAGGVTYAATQYSYDAASRLSCATVRMNMSALPAPGSDACQLGATGSYGYDRITKNGYDNADQLTSVITGYLSPAQRTDRTMTYSADGRLATILDGENNLTTYEYDGVDRLSKTRFPSAAKGSGTSSTTDYELLTYDAASNVTVRRLRDGVNIGYSYDNLNRMSHKGGTTVADRDYGYDLLGRLLSATFTTGGQSVVMSWDALGRKTSEVSPQGTVAYQYDLAGRRTRLTWPGATFYVSYDYLLTGEVTAMKENGATSLASYGYDDLGRRTGITRGNGTTTSYGYDAASRLTSLGQDLSGTASDVTQTFTGYSPAFEIMGQTRSNDAYAYPHVTGTAGYTANGLDQYLTAGTLNPAYTDARGNMTALGGKTYTYNGENLLTSVSGSPATTLSYDPLNRLYQLADSATTRQLYDGDDAIADYDGGNVLQRRWVHGLDGEPVVWYEGTGTTDKRWYHADERGSTTALSNGSGTIIGTPNAYDEYGVPKSSNQGRFLYTGQAYFTSVGLYYYKARWYAAAIGRFMSTDPIGYADGMNWYNYVGSDPINNTDPSGLEDDGPEIVVTARIPKGAPTSSPIVVGTHGRRGTLSCNGSLCVPIRPGKPTAIAPGNTNSQCGNSLEARLGRYADNTDYAAKGLALGAALTSETGVGGAVLGGAALGAEISSFGFSAAKFGVQLYNGNKRGAAATLAGVGLSFLVPKSLLGVSKFNQRFGGAAAGRFGEAFADTAGVPAGHIAEGVVGGCE